jgi:hypothetical protein
MQQLYAPEPSRVTESRKGNSGPTLKTGPAKAVKSCTESFLCRIPFPGVVRGRSFLKHGIPLGNITGPATEGDYLHRGKPYS